MASRTQNPLDEKQRALNLLAQGRDEISAEMHVLRTSMNPKRILRGAVDRHSTAVLVGAFAAGLAVPLLMVHRRHSHVEEFLPQQRPGSTPRAAAGRSLLGQILGLAVTTFLPRLVAPLVRKWLNERLISHPRVL